MWSWLGEMASGKTRSPFGRNTKLELLDCFSFVLLFFCFVFLDLLLFFIEAMKKEWSENKNERMKNNWVCSAAFCASGWVGVGSFDCLDQCGCHLFFFCFQKY